ncbi:MAG: class I SAM-dependent methyltransferase [Polyangiaceae bacterium]|nr:class I SAM-dependent methyltransferase [Polyangiaceae bacterium]MCW5789414.1 class I SAM-dependent methyltransferase [Polyangiaceae bacterium]
MAYDPALYELTHRGNPGDVEFYSRACEGARSVLELGTGYGRIALGLAAAGYEVVGLELDPGLLELARAAKAAQLEAAGAEVKVGAATVSETDSLEFVLGDMRQFELGRRFDRVIIPHSGLYCLLEPGEVASCLRAARAHLCPGGLLVLDGYAADDFHEESLPEDVPDDQLEPITEIEAQGTRYTVFEQSRWDRDSQRIDATYLYREEPSGREVRYLLPQRYLLRRELEALLDAAGFSVSLVRGSFSGDAYDEDAEHLIVIAEAS